MKLYVISQSVNNNYDTYDSAIVVAHNEEEAKTIHPTSWDKELHIYPNGDWNRQYFHPWCKTPDQVTTEYIGEASSSYTEPAVILASFNAG